MAAIQSAVALLLVVACIGVCTGEDIHAAVRTNDMTKIKAALAGGEDINKIGACSVAN